MIHFWLPSAPSSSEILAWDPETEPRRYASGVGHSIYELFNRLARRGVDVTLGTDVRPSARLTVLYAPSIEALSARKRAVDVIRRTMGRYALVRADAPVCFRLPVRPVADFLPIASAVRYHWQRCLPPLPQRGLVPRERHRCGRICSVAFKGNPENVPPELKTPDWASALRSRGMTWWLDVPHATDGSDQSWHDFAAVDVVLCLRNPSKRRDLERKPATKLLNAWSAGCIPFVEREPGYLELARDGEDAFVVESPAQCLELLDDLAANPSRVRAVEDAIERRRHSYATAVVVDLWKEALLHASGARETVGWRREARALQASAARVRGALRRS